MNVNKRKASQMLSFLVRTLDSISPEREKISSMRALRIRGVINAKSKEAAVKKINIAI